MIWQLPCAGSARLRMFWAKLGLAVQAVAKPMDCPGGHVVDQLAHGPAFVGAPAGKSGLAGVTPAAGRSPLATSVACAAQVVEAVAEDADR